MNLTVPKYLSEDERKIWKEFVKVSVVQLTDADRPALEILVCLLAKHRAKADMIPSERSAMIKLLFDFRATPGSREKLKPVDDDKTANEFANL